MKASRFEFAAGVVSVLGFAIGILAVIVAFVWATQQIAKAFLL